MHHPLFASPTLVYDGNEPLNEFLKRQPVIQACSSLGRISCFSLRNGWGKEKILVAEYKDEKTKKIEKKDICYLVWEALLKVKGTKR